MALAMGRVCYISGKLFDAAAAAIGSALQLMLVNDMLQHCANSKGFKVIRGAGVIQVGVATIIALQD
jgi:hypothetical protein